LFFFSYLPKVVVATTNTSAVGKE